MIGDCVLYHADCVELMPRLPTEVCCIITDPPYTDQHTELYKQTAIDFLEYIDCHQLIFWSARERFELDFTAVHIWDKVVGCASTYERIFERNGQCNFRMFRALLLSNQVQATIMRDDLVDHPSQKPVQLMRALIKMTSGVVIDPFMGSGSTAVACIKEGRSFIGVECDKVYFDMACKRVEHAYDGQALFIQPLLKGAVL